MPNDDKQNYFFCKLYHWLKSLITFSIGPTNQCSIKIPKALETMNKITGLKTFEYHCNKLTNVPSRPDGNRKKEPF